MTIKEFESSRFSKNTKVKFLGKVYSIAEVDFELNLIGLDINNKVKFISYKYIDLIK